MRDATKYERLAQFARTLPRIRAAVERDLARPGLPRERVLATVVRLLETTFIRVGNARYAKENDSFGLTTLRNRHVDVRGGRVRFQFRGKSGKAHAVELSDRRVAAHRAPLPRPARATSSSSTSTTTASRSASTRRT